MNRRQQRIGGRRTLARAVLVALWLGLLLPGAGAQSVTVSVAASLRLPMEELERRFLRQHGGARIVWNFGASGALRQQIEQGAPVDVFLPAASRQMDLLEQKGLLAVGTRRDLLVNEVVLIAPRAAPQPRDFAGLVAADVRLVALGDPASVPAGEYGQQVLRALGLWERVQSRLVLAKDVRQVLAYVESGNTDAGIVYASDAKGAERVRVVATAPAGSHAPIVYPVAVVAGAREPALARAFVAFLATNEATTVFRNFGFLPGGSPLEPTAAAGAKPLDLSPLWISLQTAAVATLLTFGLGLAAAYWMSSYRGRARNLVDGLFLLPLVLPPTVIGFFLLLLFGRNSTVGQALESLGITIAFSWPATVIAATVVAFPMMYRASLGALEQVMPTLLQAARTLGASEWMVFRRVTLPLAWPGILAGTVLAFARALGEFGATLMLAGNIPGRTQTIPVAIFFAAEGGEMNRALGWVLLIVAVSLVAIAGLGYWSRYQPKRGGQMAPAEESEAVPLGAGYQVGKASSDAAQGTLEFAAIKPLSGFSLATSFTVHGGPVGLLGASGSGKSLSLGCIAGIETPEEGRIVLNGRVLFDRTLGINLPPAERRIGVLFQDFALFPNMTVAGNVGFGLQPLSPAKQDARITDALRLVRIEALRDRYPAELSGGQRQRVALARALATHPDALLLDEPFSALDPHLRRQLENQLREALRGYEGVVVFVTHDMEEAFRFCQDLVVLDRGRVIAAGPKRDLFERPGTTAAARLTGCKNVFSAAMRDDGSIAVPALGISLTIGQPPRPDLTHVGIRARHLRMVEEGSGRANVFPCWLRETRESPHEMTLYLQLQEGAGQAHLEMQISKDDWKRLEAKPEPWMLELAPDRLLLLEG
jgi:molybdate transport system permease protein